MRATHWCLWGVSLLLLGLMVIFPPVQEWVEWHGRTMPQGYRFIGSLYMTPSVTVDFPRLFWQIALLLVLSFCLDWFIRGWAIRKDSPWSTWLIGTRNVLGMLLGIEIILGIFLSDPGFRDMYDTIGLLRFTAFNTWAFLYVGNASGLWMISVSLLLDAALIVVLWRFPRHGFSYGLATIYFLVRLCAGLYSVHATPYSVNEVGALTRTLILGGALSNLIPTAISGLGILMLRRLKSQSSAIEESVS